MIERMETMKESQSVSSQLQVDSFYSGSERSNSSGEAASEHSSLKLLLDIFPYQRSEREAARRAG